LHLQRPPFAETKLVRVTRGAIFDVIVDLRAGSPTYAEWFAVELSEQNHKQLYIPCGFAHGFQTLTDIAHVTYHMSVAFAAGAQDGIRWNDPTLGIPWPHANQAIVSERDSLLRPLASFEPIEF
jgi:dTDP-4-dehydrorhamnose 3,5-epimerase